MLQCVAVSCSVLQCVAVSCSVLFVVICCNVWQCLAMCGSVLQSVAVIDLCQDAAQTLQKRRARPSRWAITDPAPQSVGRIASGLGSRCSSLVGSICCCSVLQCLVGLVALGGAPFQDPRAVCISAVQKARARRGRVRGQVRLKCERQRCERQSDRYQASPRTVPTLLADRA